MDEGRYAELRRRLRAHPAFRGGPADEGYWLDLMELLLENFGSYGFKVEMLAENLERHPDRVPAYVSAAAQDRFAWDVLDQLVRQLWLSGKTVPPALVRWWMDKTTAVSTKPRGTGDHVRRNEMRDLMIVWAVNGIRNVTDLPYEFDAPAPSSGREPRTACHVVAERLGWKYERVRSIWQKNRSILNRAREHGLIPPERARRRRTA